MGLRRRSREKTLQILYSLEFNTRENPFGAVFEYYDYFELPLPHSGTHTEEEKEFVNYLINQVYSNTERIELLIEKAAINWRIDRIAYIERNILRVAVAELVDESNGIPFKATINEAIDIAKKFGSKESPGFINGIINKVADILDIKRKKA